MKQLCEVRTRLLLEMSADIHNRMAEIWALREAVRTAEATPRGLEPNNAAILARSPGDELRA
jgi:hypothetical protein